MAKAVSMSVGIEGAEIFIDYLDSNKRISKVNWLLPSNLSCTVRIWVNESLVYEHTEIGPSSGSENVPGSFNMVYIEPIDDTPYWDIPPEIVYEFGTEVI